ncbi:UNVERIFIED_CONTAM: hypothetical protein O8I53_13115 [Campylobacter lari]
MYFAEFININQCETKLFKSYDQDPLKTLDLTFEIAKYQNISDKINEIKTITDVFEIKQIDDYAKQENRNVTLRISGTNEQINLINSHFNKK